MLVIDKKILPGGLILTHDIGDYPGGIVLPVDKPYRWTSADVIRKIKFAAVRHFGKKNLKVGHAGTLDPLATGVLLVCIGNATKQAQALQDHDKEYIAGISFGATTPSYDLEKDVDRLFPHDNVSENSIRAVLPSFLGEQEQIAPLFSAKSVDGVRAYEMARRMYRKSQGEGDFDKAAAEILHKSVITVYEAELLSFSAFGRPPRRESADGDSKCRINVADTSALGLPHADIRIACSKGTYVRAFARDLGEALGTGAHLDGLCRSATGAFRVEDSITVAEALSLFSA